MIQTVVNGEYIVTDGVLSIVKECNYGNFDKFNYLVEIFTPTIWYITSSFYILGADKEDLFQEGLVGLYKATQVFDLNKGSNFEAFAKLCIRRSIMQAVRASNSNKQLIHNKSLLRYNYENDEKESINKIIAPNHYNPESVLISNENRREIFLLISKILTKFEQDVLKLFLCDKTYSEISLDLGKNIKSIDNALIRIRKKIRKFKHEVHECGRF